MRPFWLSMLLALVLVPVSAGAEQFSAANVHRSDYPSVEAMAHMARLIAERTAGRHEVTLLPEDSDSGPFTIQRVRNGRLAMAAVNVNQLNNIVPATIALSLPFLFETEAQLRRTLEGPVGQEILAALDQAGLVGLCFYDAGYRSIYTMHKPIRSAADLKGLAIRTQRSEMEQAIVRSMGARAVPIPYNMVHDGLKSRLIDAAEDNASAFLSSLRYDVARAYSLTRHARPPEVLVMSKEIWQRLSPEDQEIIRTAAQESVPLQRRLRHEREAMALQTAAALGVEVVTDIDRQSFIKAIAPVYAIYAADPVVKNLVERIRAEATTAR
jgi:tripartite ATP-independent transporter DctP family solute receptor